MTRNELNNEYFEWMYRLATKKPRYRKLLRRLHETEFIYILPVDGNRAEDGTDLRYRFGYEQGYEGARIASYLDDKPCSVLEMMVALSIRCEEHIMGDPDVGDRTSFWFECMIDSLGLSDMDDRSFNKHRVDEIIDIFMNRKYESDGKGGLFTVEHPRRDMRSVEIWYQMCWFLSEYA